MSSKNPNQPRRIWYGPEKLKAAFLAGQGKSAKEISQLIGGTTPQRVRAMLSEHDIILTRVPGEDVVTIRWKKADRERLDAAAARLDRPSAELAGLITRKILTRRPELIDELIHELDVL